MKDILPLPLLAIIIACLACSVNGNSFLPKGANLKITTSLRSCQHVNKCMSGITSDGNKSILNPIAVERSFLTSIPRGGSLTVNRQDEEEDGNIIITKLRNIIRSIIDVGTKKSPISTKVFKLLIKCVEKVTGIELLPPKKSKKKIDIRGKNQKSKRKKKAQKNEQVVDEKSNTKSKKKATPSKKTSNNSGAAHSHLAKNIKTTNPNYRIQRELKEFLSSPPPNLSVKVGKNIRVWIITMVGTKGSLYENETYRLKVTFPPDYPTAPPSVYFLQPTPRHEHVYTNGDICLSLLGKDWRPTMTAQSIANSILSILSGASRKSLPMDNVAHAQNKPGGKQDDWIYHDDNC